MDLAAGLAFGMEKLISPRVYINALFCVAGLAAAQDRALYFPPPGEGMDAQQRITLRDAGMHPSLIENLRGVADRWALWNDGRLVHVHGDFNLSHDVASNRKTWHAMIVGAAIHQGRIPSLDQKINVWTKALAGNDAEATWRHVITQSAGLDYPYGAYPDFAPGKMWTYSDLNLVQLCRGLARVFGKSDYTDDYASVAKQAYFDAIGMRGWTTVIKKDGRFSGPNDGVRFVLDLEDMGRLGLLALAKGNWNGRQLVPAWFVEELENKQTRGMRVNYDGPNDGQIGYDAKEFPEAPYGFLTWTNTDGDLLPGADRGWAYASGAGGFKTFWNRKFGIVFATAGAKRLPRERDIPQLIEAGLQARETARQ
jgi:CubicO group peptidase (beta-lactamase class C family)